jgi:hypothetical protein
MPVHPRPDLQAGTSQRDVQRHRLPPRRRHLRRVRLPGHADRHVRERQDHPGGAARHRGGLCHGVPVRRRHGLPPGLPRPPGALRHHQGVRPLLRRRLGGPVRVGHRLRPRRVVDGAVRARRRRHLHQGGGRWRGPRREGGAQHPRGRPEEPRGDRGQRGRQRRRHRRDGVRPLRLLRRVHLRGALRRVHFVIRRRPRLRGGGLPAAHQRRGAPRLPRHHAPRHGPLHGQDRPRRGPGAEAAAHHLHRADDRRRPRRVIRGAPRQFHHVRFRSGEASKELVRNGSNPRSLTHGNLTLPESCTPHRIKLTTNWPQWQAPVLLRRHWTMGRSRHRVHHRVLHQQRLQVINFVCNNSAGFKMSS